MMTITERNAVVKYIAPGKTRWTYMKYVHVCTNSPVGTSFMKALCIGREHADVIATNLRNRGYRVEVVVL